MTGVLRPPVLGGGMTLWSPVAGGSITPCERESSSPGALDVPSPGPVLDPDDPRDEPPGAGVAWSSGAGFALCAATAPPPSASMATRSTIAIEGLMGSLRARDYYPVNGASPRPGSDRALR